MMFGAVQDITTLVAEMVVVGGAILTGAVAAVTRVAGEVVPHPKMFLALYLNWYT